jgi:hypothetical protein
MGLKVDFQAVELVLLALLVDHTQPLEDLAYIHFLQ